MKIDDHEPDNIEALLKQSLKEVIRAPLNQHGYADYVWNMLDGEVEQVERKRASEILGGIEHVEDQLRRELQSKPHARLWLLVEDVVLPTPTGTVVMKIERHRGKECLMPGIQFNMRYSRFETWMTALERIGVRVKRTADYRATAIALALMESSAQHQTTILHRHQKLRVAWHPNPQVMTLMGTYRVEIVDGKEKTISAGIGPELAEKILGEFRSIANFVNLPPEMIADLVPGMGIVRAKKLLEAFGRKFDEA